MRYFFYKILLYIVMNFKYFIYYFSESDDNGHKVNIPKKLFPLETFQFSIGFKSDNDEHSQNIHEKLFPLETFQFPIDFNSDNDLHP